MTLPRQTKNQEGFVANCSIFIFPLPHNLKSFEQTCEVPPTYLASIEKITSTFFCWILQTHFHSALTSSHQSLPRKSNFWPPATDHCPANRFPPFQQLPKFLCNPSAPFWYHSTAMNVLDRHQHQVRSKKYSNFQTLSRLGWNMTSKCAQYELRDSNIKRSSSSQSGKNIILDSYRHNEKMVWRQPCVETLRATRLFCDDSTHANEAKLMT